MLIDKSILTGTSTQFKGASETTLSSLAYSDASSKLTGANRSFASFAAMKAAARVRRGNAARRQYRVDVHADMLKIQRPRPLTGLPKYATMGGGKRGAVTGFSRASRKRLIEFMASVRNTGDMYFVTMTYDDRSWVRNQDYRTPAFEAFRRRFERAFPNWRAIWRMELKKRLSGALIGETVPHFHLLVFTNRSDSDEEKKAIEHALHIWGTDAWGEVLQTDNPDFQNYGFHVAAVRSRKHAYSYVSKYIGKKDTDGVEAGRRWGRIGQFQTSPSETLYVSEDEIIEFKRMVKKWMKARNNQRHRENCKKAALKGKKPPSRTSGFERRLDRIPMNYGFVIFGLGDASDANGEFGSAPVWVQLTEAAKVHSGAYIATGGFYGE